MCLLTLSAVRATRRCANTFPRRLYSGCPGTDIKPENIPRTASSTNLLDVSSSWPATEMELQKAACRDMRVIPNFISEEEEKSLLAELDPYLKKMRYEYDHWDDAIHGYKETERRNWSQANWAILSRVRESAFSEEGSGSPQDFTHVLDLAPGGHIKPHIDATRYCGEVIAGLSLLSSRVMQLQHETRAELVLKALLPQRSLYIMRGVSRYAFKHSVLGSAESEFQGSRIPCLRRVAIITRSVPPKVQDDQPFSPKEG